MKNTPIPAFLQAILIASFLIAIAGFAARAQVAEPREIADPPLAAPVPEPKPTIPADKQAPAEVPPNPTNPKTSIPDVVAPPLDHSHDAHDDHHTHGNKKLLDLESD